MIGYNWTEETVAAAAKIMGPTNQTFRFYWPYILFNPWPVVGHSRYIGPWYSAFQEFVDAGLAEAVDVGWLNACPTCKQAIAEGVMRPPAQYKLSSKGEALLSELIEKFGKLEFA